MIHSFHESRGIRVVMVPVGDISPNKYSEYSTLIKSFSIIDLNNITREPSYKTPLEKLSWQEGQVCLNMINSSDYQASDWEDFQVYRKVLGVIGIIHCQRSPDLLGTYSRFEQVLQQQFPKAVANICFAFDPMPDQPDVFKGNLVMIPPGDKKQLSFYLSTLILDFAHILIKHIEKMVSETDQSAYISTPLDPCKTVDEISRLKRRKQGRQNKWKGDYCLLAGSPQDSMVYYNLAIDQCKSNNDWEWAAGALEGSAAALVAKKNYYYTSTNSGDTQYLQNNTNFASTSTSTTQSFRSSLSFPHLHHSTGPGSITKNQIPLLDNDTSKEDQEIIEKSQEAIGHYNKRKAVFLELELTLKLAGYYASLERKQEAVELLTAAYEVGADFSTQDKTQLTINIALMCRSMGYKRKFAFFIREAAILSSKIYNTNVAHGLLSWAASYYQLGDLSSEFSFDEQSSSTNVPIAPPPPSSATRKGRAATRKLTSKAKPINHEKEGWGMIQRVILMNLVATSKSVGEPITVCRYIILLLRTQYLQLAAFKQQELAQDLLTFAKQMHSNPMASSQIGILGLPFLVRLDPIPLPSHLLPTPKQSEKSPAGPFFYSPYGQKNSAKNNVVKWVQGELCGIRVVFSNPLAFEILVQSLTVSTKGTPFEAIPLSFSIPPHTPSYEVICSGRPLGVGNLTILGCVVKSFGIVCEHPIHPTGVAITLKEIEKINKAKGINNNTIQGVINNIQTLAESTKLLSDSSDIPDVNAMNRCEITLPLPNLIVRYPPLGSTTNLYAGERTTVTMEIENSGSLTIDFLDITAVPIKINTKNAQNAGAKKSMPNTGSGVSETPNLDTHDEDEDIDVFVWDKYLLSSHLPLLPGTRYSLPIHIYAKPLTAGANFQFTYGSIPKNSPDQTIEYYRKLILPYNLNIQQGPKLVNFSIIITNSNALSHLRPFLMYPYPLNISQRSGLSVDKHFATQERPKANNNNYGSSKLNSPEFVHEDTDPNANMDRQKNNTTSNEASLLGFNTLDTIAAFGGSPKANDPNVPNLVISLHPPPNTPQTPPTPHIFEYENDICLLAFDIHNPSSQLFRVSCYIEPENDSLSRNSGSYYFASPPASVAKNDLGQKTASAPQSTQRVLVAVRRMLFPEEGQLPAPKTSSKRQYIRPKKERSEKEEYQWRLIQYYRAILLRKIRITWESNDNTYGSVMLNNLDIPFDMLKKLSKDPIILGFSLPNSNMLTPSSQNLISPPLTMFAIFEGTTSPGQNSITGTPHPTPSSSVSIPNVTAHSQYVNVKQTFKLGTFEQIVFTVRNNNNKVLNEVLLVIEPYQDYGNGTRVTNLGKKMSWVGTLEVLVPTLLPNGRFDHHITVCFLDTGVYSFITYCKSKPPSQNISSINNSGSVVSNNSNNSNNGNEGGSVVDFLFPSSPILRVEVIP